MDGFGKALRSVDVRLCNFSSSVVVLVEWLARRKANFRDGSVIDRVILIPRHSSSFHSGGGHALPFEPNMSTSPCRGTAWGVIIGETRRGHDHDDDGSSRNR